MFSTIGLEISDRLSIPESKIRDAALILFGSMLIAVSAQLTIRLPFSLVPITGQTFAVLMVGFLFGWKRGLLSVLAYLAEGAAGLPVFSGGGAGIAWLLGPTGGYLVGFAGAAALVGYLAEKGLDRNIHTTLLAFAVGQAVIYLMGAGWLSIFTGIETALQTGVIPFLAGDALKAIFAALMLPGAWKFLK